MQRMPILIACAATLAALGGAGIAMSRSEASRGASQVEAEAIAGDVSGQKSGQLGSGQESGQESGQLGSGQLVLSDSQQPSPPVSSTPPLSGEPESLLSTPSTSTPTTTTPFAEAKPSLPDVIRRLALKAQVDPAQPYQPQYVLIRDEIKPGSDFDRFRQQFRSAVRDRDANFLRQVAHENVKLSFGSGVTLEQRLAEPDDSFWPKLERAIGGDCAVDGADHNPNYRACPASFAVEAHHPEIDPYLTVYVNGTDVAVRQLPSVKSPVLTRVSNSILQSVSLPWDETLSEAEDAQLNAWHKASETDQGWKFVSLPDGRKGFVSSRYAYSALGYRAIFQRDETNRWVMTAFVAGD